MWVRLFSQKAFLLRSCSGSRRCRSNRARSSVEEGQECGGTLTRGHLVMRRGYNRWRGCTGWFAMAIAISVASSIVVATVARLEIRNGVHQALHQWICPAGMQSIGQEAVYIAIGQFAAGVGLVMAGHKLREGQQLLN